MLMRSTDTRYYYGLRTRRSDETLREDQRNTLLLQASAEGQLHRVKHLLRLGTDVDFSDEDGFTALHHAVTSGFEDCVQELISKGSDVNAMSRYGVALNLAARKERAHVISILLAARADKERAIRFVARQGQDVSDLTSLFDNPVTPAGVDTTNVLGAVSRKEVERWKIFSPGADARDTEMEREEKRSDKANDERNHPHITAAGGSRTRNDDQRSTYKRYHESARLDDGEDMNRKDATGSGDGDIDNESTAGDVVVNIPRSTSFRKTSDLEMRRLDRAANRPHPTSQPIPEPECWPRTMISPSESTNACMLWLERLPSEA
jgi:hypothetical protein